MRHACFTASCAAIALFGTINDAVAAMRTAFASRCAAIINVIVIFGTVVTVFIGSLTDTVTAVTRAFALGGAGTVAIAADVEGGTRFGIFAVVAFFRGIDNAVAAEAVALTSC